MLEGTGKRCSCRTIESHVEIDGDGSLIPLQEGEDSN